MLVKKRSVRGLLAGLLLSGVAACGQTGPLYLPKDSGSVVERPAEADGRTPPQKKTTSENQEPSNE